MKILKCTILGTIALAFGAAVGFLTSPTENLPEAPLPVHIYNQLSAIADPSSLEIKRLVDETAVNARPALALRILQDINETVNGSSMANFQRVRLAILRRLGSDAAFTAPVLTRYLVDYDPLVNDVISTLFAFDRLGWDAIAKTLRDNPYSFHAFTNLFLAILDHGAKDPECAEFIFSNSKTIDSETTFFTNDAIGQAVHLLVEKDDLLRISILSESMSARLRKIAILAAERLPVRDATLNVVYRGLEDVNDDNTVTAAYCILYFRVNKTPIPKNVIDQAVLIFRELDGNSTVASNERAVTLLSETKRRRHDERSAAKKKDVTWVSKLMFGQSLPNVNLEPTEKSKANDDEITLDSVKNSFEDASIEMSTIYARAAIEYLSNAEDHDAKLRGKASWDFVKDAKRRNLPYGIYYAHIFAATEMTDDRDARRTSTRATRP